MNVKAFIKVLKLELIPWTDKQVSCLWRKFKKFNISIETAIWQHNGDLRSLGKYHVVSPWCFFTLVFHPCSPLFTLVLHAKQVIGLEAELCTIPLHRPVIKQCLVLPDFMESFALGLLQPDVGTKVLPCLTLIGLFHVTLFL